MRKSKAAAAETRERIVATAASEFRGHGIAATGLADLMAAAGLTHGGFYRHFQSKEQLVSEACERALSAVTEDLAAVAQKQSPAGGLESLVSKYLSPGHRDHPENGCALAALGSELARSGEDARKIAIDGYLRLVKIIAGQLEGVTSSAAETRAMAIAAAMVGAVTLSRIATDPRTSGRVLSATKDFILAKESRSSSLV